MATYRTGTITVTNGSKAVTGASTLFKTAGVVSGDQLYIVDANNIPTGYLYEVDVVDSDTLITLKQNYQGTTASGQNYMIMNMAGNQTVPNFASRLAPVMQSWGDIEGKISVTPQIDGIPQADETGKIDKGWLPDATTEAKGVVKVGTNISVADGVISVPDASTVAKGMVKIGTNLSVADGVISVPDATTEAKGVVKVGANINVTEGTISVSVASETVKGVSELATSAEVLAGTDTERPITPKTLTDKILGTVSQSSGVPTGAIIESGSNANGHYIKHADGTMICYMPRKSMGNIACTTVAATGVRYISAGVDITFPATFIDRNVSASFSVCAASNTPKPYYFDVGAENFGTGTILFEHTTNTSTATTINLTLIGRWF